MSTATLAAPTQTTTAQPDNAQRTAASNPAAAGESKEIRGFALYIGVTEEQLNSGNTTLTELVQKLKAELAKTAPGAQSYATLALAPSHVGGRDIDVVRYALCEPAARAKVEREKATQAALDRAASGITVDLSRKRVLLDNVPAPLTFREFELLQFFVLREGVTITREDIIEALWSDAPATEVPNARTIDVHVRRLRVKLAQYHDIIRTVRGSGYRFDRHADVRIVAGQATSPDVY